MHLFECDLCPRKLKCQLKDERNRIMKKWCGDKMFKKMWDRIDAVVDEKSSDPLITAANIGLKIGFIGGAAREEESSLKTWNDMFDDIKMCLSRVVTALKPEEKK